MAILLGAEIELEYNMDKILFNCGEYHHGKMFGCNGWTAERDGSLCTEKFRNNGATAEIVSRVSTVPEFLRALENFKRYFSNNGEYELGEVINFNRTTGAHLHFSYGTRKFWDRVKVSSFFKTRSMFFKKLQASKIGSKNEIRRQYFRNYAQRLTPDKYSNNSDRRSEFNFVCESEVRQNRVTGQNEVISRGIEWRSLNLVGITKWSELFEFYQIVIDCVKYLVESAWDFQINKPIEIEAEPVIEEMLEIEVDCSYKRKRTESLLRVEDSCYLLDSLALEQNLRVNREDNLEREEDIILG